MKNKLNQAGISLIELMIAVLIAVFLLAGVLQIFINSKQTNKMQINMSRLQENGRFALDFMANDIRTAGYWDCMAPMAGATNKDITGTDGALGTPDSITLRAAFMPIAYCDWSLHAEVANNAYTAPTTQLNVYNAPTSIITYSISAGNFLNKSNQNIVEGIENMEIKYGVDALDDDSVDYYVPQANVVDWSKVISVRIKLLVVTLDDNLRTEKEHYTFNDKEFTAKDLKIRRIFTSTIVLRNRLK